MAKARRLLQENVSLCDVVIEIVDARAPLASRNPDFDDLFRQKTRIVLLNKADLASPPLVRRWIAYYAAQGIPAAQIVSTGSAGKKQAVALIEEATRDKVQKKAARGIRMTVRALVVGIPNVGKSTFINRMAGQTRAKTGDKPGVTKGKQWVKITPYLELMDSPGLLWPKLEDPVLAEHLAFLGSINDEIMDVEQLAASLLISVRRLDPDALYARYPKLSADTPDISLLEGVAKSRGFLLPGGVLDTERAARIVLDEFRAGRIAHLTLETPPEDS